MNNLFGVLPKMSVRLSLLLLVIVFHPACMSCFGQVIYSNDFNCPLGSQFPEWTSSTIQYASEDTPPKAGTLPAQVITNVNSHNRAQRFLGEFGGPATGKPGEPGYNQTLVEQTVRLNLHDLPDHKKLSVSFDLYILKSWDGASPQYGPDQWSLSVEGVSRLFESTFSNNFKVEKEGSDQSFPRPRSQPHSGAVSSNTMGYDFFGDSVYHFDFTFLHSGSGLTLHFYSSLFEGKGTADESWGLDNVEITVVPDTNNG